MLDRHGSIPGACSGVSSAVAQPPVNFRNRSQEEIAAAADYAVSAGNSAVGVMDGHRVPVTGTILEIGPGSDFGASLILGERCKKLILADHTSERRVKSLLTRCQTMTKKEIEKLAKS